MRTLSIFLKISAWLFIPIGAFLFNYSSYYMVLCLSVALAVYAVALKIDQKSQWAAWAGMALMVLYVPSLFIFLGIPGLLSAYRDRQNWMAWGGAK